MRRTLRLADLLGGLSIVADLGFGLPPEEAMRSCLPGEILSTGDRVVVLGTMRGRRSESGETFETPFAHLWTLSAGTDQGASGQSYGNGWPRLSDTPSEISVQNSSQY